MERHAGGEDVNPSGGSSVSYPFYSAKQPLENQKGFNSALEPEEVEKSYKIAQSKTGIYPPSNKRIKTPIY